MPVSIGELTGYVGKGIADICSNGFADPHQNHCAHFVSHALGIKLGMLCGDMKHSTKHSGASLRVDEIFNQLSRRGTWENVPPNSDGALIFVVSAKAVHGNRMINIPQKHVGDISWRPGFQFFEHPSQGCCGPNG